VAGFKNVGMSKVSPEGVVIVEYEVGVLVSITWFVGAEESMVVGRIDK
jgi:hypothetical protein